MERMLEHWKTLLEGVAADAGRRIGELPLLSEAELEQVVVDWNRTEREYAGARTVHGLVEAQVRRSPQAVAVIGEGERLSYGELNGRANRLARRLRGLGLQAEDRVGVFLERSVELVVALLAVLKAGGAYVPLEPDYPRPRLAQMLADAAPAVVLSRAGLAAALPAHGGRTVWLEPAEEPAGEEAGSADLELAIDPQQLAYIIYTSGSTGQAKGAMNSHGAVRNRLLWMQERYRLGASDRVLQKTPCSFDVSVWEFFWPLLSGAALVLARPGGHQDSGYLVERMAAEAVTTVHFVPSMLEVFLQEPELERLGALRRVICSGEALSGQLRDRFFARLGAELHNLYGPTEAAVDVTAWECGRQDRGAVPIGAPIGNLRMYVLDSYGEAAPAGVAGELYIGGAGLGRGYYGQPGLTAESWVPDRFGSRGERLYRTGDQGRWGAGGQLEYLGRQDYQVKIRGNRIELGEIEAALRQLEGVREAVVLLRPDARQAPSLVAYLTPREGLAGAAELRRQLRERLPEPMLPALFVALDHLPLLPNGKIDRRALPDPQAAPLESSLPSLPPRTPMEEEIASIWRDLLRVDYVGSQDNFFALGGHSLLLAQIAGRIRRNYAVDIALRDLFDAPSVAEMAIAIAERQVQHAGGEDEATQILEELKRCSTEELLAILNAEASEKFGSAA